MKTSIYFGTSTAFAVLIICYFGRANSVAYDNSIADKCNVNVLAKELFKPRLEVIREEPEECGENEVYHIANVTNYCQMGCATGCYCKEGYVRLSSRKGCVTIEDAEMKCKKNEEIVCGPEDCEPMCDIDQDEFCYLNRYDCYKSYYCRCKKGYIRLDDGPCIRIEECPSKIYKTEEFTET